MEKIISWKSIYVNEGSITFWTFYLILFDIKYMSVLKKLAGETALYGVSSILGRVIYWFLVPLHTHVFLRPGELSSNTELYSWVALFNVIFTFGMETAFFRFANRNPEHRQE